MNPAPSDDEILELTKLELEPDQDTRLSELLELQQAGMLKEGNRVELHTLLVASYSKP